MYRRILAPTDGSPVSSQAAASAIAFARACGAELVALSVAVPAPAFQSLDGAMAPARPAWPAPRSPAARSTRPRPSSRRRACMAAT